MSEEKAAVLLTVFLLLSVPGLYLKEPATPEPILIEPRGLSHVKTPSLATGTAPLFAFEPRDPSSATYGVLVNFTAIVRDADNDALRVTWDWGDGTANVTTTGPAGVNTIIRNGHIYTPPTEQGRGDYLHDIAMTIYLDDGNGNNVSCTTLVQVLMPPNGYPARPSLRLNGTTSPPLDPSEVVYVVANCSDPEGESLTWTIMFTNATDAVYRTMVVNTPATEPNENVWVNISHSFGTEGRHRIDVYVSDALVPYQIYPHNRTGTIFADVVVNRAPAVTTVINVDPSNPVIDIGTGYVDVSFHIELFDADGDVVTVTWDFGDGTAPSENITSGGPFVFTLTQQHRYVDTGVFNVTVIATDGRPGHEVLRYELLTVTSNNLPPQFVLFSFTCHGLIPPFDHVGEAVFFTLTVTDPELDAIEVEWDFGDGSPHVIESLSEYVGSEVMSSVEHTYSAPGYYTIWVNYTDNQEGVLDHLRYVSDNLEIIVDDSPPHADAGTDQAVLAGDTVHFDGSGSWDNWAIANYTWTFVYNGSEITLWGPSPDFEFWTPGLYVVTLNITDMVGLYNASSVSIAVTEEIPEFGSVIPVASATVLVLALMMSLRRRRRD